MGVFQRLGIRPQNADEGWNIKPGIFYVGFPFTGKEN